MNSSSNYDPTAALVSLFFSFLILIGFQIAMGYLSKNIQTKKGYQDSGFWIGFFLGLIGIVYSAGLPDLFLRNKIESLENLYKKIQYSRQKEQKVEVQQKLQEQPKVEEQPKTEDKE